MVENAASSPSAAANSLSVLSVPGALSTKAASSCCTNAVFAAVVSLSPVEAASNNLLKSHVGLVLESLNHREQRVLQLRFGLEDGRSRTLEEVGREFGVTRERIRQIEAKALRKLRHPTRSKKLRDFMDPSY